tara:strand:+ start:519 stop:926 length:408 start_codon:yes stop_codon:yes gene_type:complete
MPTEFKKIDPLDLQPRKAIGVDIPFSGNAVFNSTFTTKDAIRANLINYFLTNPGERFFNVDFGAGLRQLLFEPINEDNIEELRGKILDDLQIFFPKVKPTKIELNGIPESNTVEFTMRYAIADSNIEDDILINFE